MEQILIKNIIVFKTFKLFNNFDTTLQEVKIIVISKFGRLIKTLNLKKLSIYQLLVFMEIIMENG